MKNLLSSGMKILDPDAQKRLLEAFQTTPEEENWDVFSIAVIEWEFLDGDNE